MGLLSSRHDRDPVDLAGFSYGIILKILICKLNLIESCSEFGPQLHLTLFVTA